jgi:hypothetical protein
MNTCIASKILRRTIPYCGGIGLLAKNLLTHPPIEKHKFTIYSEAGS